MCIKLPSAHPAFRDSSETPRAGKDKLTAPVYPMGLNLLPLEGAGEVQTPFVIPEDSPDFSLGDPIFLQHGKGGRPADGSKIYATLGFI